MASYQDLESRVRVLEDKIKLVMQVASVTKKTPSSLMPGEFYTEQMSLEQLYREIQTQGAKLEKVEDGDAD